MAIEPCIFAVITGRSGVFVTKHIVQKDQQRRNFSPAFNESCKTKVSNKHYFTHFIDPDRRFKK